MNANKLYVKSTKLCLTHPPPPFIPPYCTLNNVHTSHKIRGCGNVRKVLNVLYKPPKPVFFFDNLKLWVFSETQGFRDTPSLCYTQWSGLIESCKKSVGESPRVDKTESFEMSAKIAGGCWTPETCSLHGNHGFLKKRIFFTSNVKPVWKLTVPLIRIRDMTKLKKPQLFCLN